MQTAPEIEKNQGVFSSLNQEELLAFFTEEHAESPDENTDLKQGFIQHLARMQKQFNAQQAQLQEKEEQLQTQQALSRQQADCIRNQAHRIHLLEELVRLRRIQKFAASSEKLGFQIDLFDEAELASQIAALQDEVGEEPGNETDAQARDAASQTNAEDAEPKKPSSRQRGFSDQLKRVRVELRLSDEERAAAARTFFTKVKEELEYIPATLQVLEYWQEKAVVETEAGSDQLIAATRPVHPLGKCTVSTSLLAQIITAKYADGLPLYRQEGILKRYGGDISRANMANWIIRLEETFKPLLNLIREEQNASDYLQIDETRIQVLKEAGKTAQSDKWMWVVRGGPPDKPAVMFHYDASRSAEVPMRLLDDFQGVLQADGYVGYDPICRVNGLTRIGCWDHARRKFVEASQAAAVGKGASQADVGLGKIRKLYALESKIETQSPEEKRTARQAIAKPILDDLKAWLDPTVSRVMKGGLTHKAIQYTLNQWDRLTGYCEEGKLHISNVLAENAIRPFAVGRKAWLFADTPKGAHASAACYSLVETAKANQLEPYAYLNYLLDHIGLADTLEKLEALLPWNVPQEALKKRVNAFDGGSRRI